MESKISAGKPDTVLAAATRPAAIKPKTVGETRVVMVLGMSERCNGIAHEIHLRRIFESRKDWSLVAVRSAGLLTPSLIRDADLLVVCRNADPDPIDPFEPGGGVATSVAPGKAFWTDANISAIVENVERRGMGLLALHDTIFCGNHRFMTFLDVAGLEAHLPEPVWYTRINKEHPITQKVGKFAVVNDEQPLVVIKSPSTATLFESTAVHEKRQGFSGWALDRGKGRVVGLLPGNTGFAFRTPEFQNLVWRSAFWAMRRDIPEYPKAENRYYAG